MNYAVIMGRLVRDPEVRVTPTGTKIARYTIAVDRPTTGPDGTREADFIPCVAFNKAADFAESYLHQATKILVDGRIQTGSYTNKDGQRVYTTEIIVQHHEFCESRNSESAPRQTPHSGYQKKEPAPAKQSSYQQTSLDDMEGGFMPIDDYDVSDEGLPFN